METAKDGGNEKDKGRKMQIDIKSAKTDRDSETGVCI